MIIKTDKEVKEKMSRKKYIETDWRNTFMI